MLILLDTTAMVGCVGMMQFHGLISENMLDLLSGYITAPDYTTNSEMGHLFYDEMGGVFGTSITTPHNGNFSLFHFPADVIFMPVSALITSGTCIAYVD